jgi:hypothetical protein
LSQIENPFDADVLPHQPALRELVNEALTLAQCVLSNSNIQL